LPRLTLCYKESLADMATVQSNVRFIPLQKFTERS